MKQLPRLLKKYFNNYFIIFLFIAAGFVLYANTFQNQMFWDDNDSILHNHLFKISIIFQGIFLKISLPEPGF